MELDANTKVKFSVGIGFARCEQEDEFTLEQLGYDPSVDKDIDVFLTEAYIEWRNDQLDGWYTLGGKE